MPTPGPADHHRHVLQRADCEERNRHRGSLFHGDKKASAKYYGNGLRHHWGIENNLHWQLDVNFAEDANRVKKRNAVDNLALLRRLTLSLLKAHPFQGRHSQEALRRRPGPQFSRRNPAERRYPGEA